MPVLVNVPKHKRTSRWAVAKLERMGERERFLESLATATPYEKANQLHIYVTTLMQDLQDFSDRILRDTKKRIFTLPIAEYPKYFAQWQLNGKLEGLYATVYPNLTVRITAVLNEEIIYENYEKDTPIIQQFIEQYKENMK